MSETPEVAPVEEPEPQDTAGQDPDGVQGEDLSQDPNWQPDVEGL